MISVVKTLLVSLVASLLASGLILLPQWTASARNSTHGVGDTRDCIYEGQNWDCSKMKSRNQIQDPGAVAWVEIPSNYFLHDFELSTSWNSYIGSGYPEFLNGHNRSVSPSRLFLSVFPGDQGRDFLIFFRLLIWSFGFAFLIYLFGGSWKLQFFAALFSHLIPYPAIYVDHVFLDVDMLAPWLMVWAVLSFRAGKEKIFYISSAALGLWLGIQSFFNSGNYFNYRCTGFKK